jgi:hypothetical protein
MVTKELLAPSSLLKDKIMTISYLDIIKLLGDFPGVSEK